MPLKLASSSGSLPEMSVDADIASVRRQRGPRQRSNRAYPAGFEKLTPCEHSGSRSKFLASGPRCPPPQVQVAHPADLSSASLECSMS
jgi:hypothetical protein